MDEDAQVGVRRMNFRFVGVAALIMTLTCLFIGQAAVRFASPNLPAGTEQAALNPHFNAIDYATTSSTKSGVVVIGPCDTHPK